MIETVSVGFDFHDVNNGRDAFRDFAGRISDRFQCDLPFADDPIFSYGRDKRDRLQEFAASGNDAPIIVFLSNIVLHSSVLVAGLPSCAEFGCCRKYDNWATFRASPAVRGYNVLPEELKDCHTFDRSTLVISNLCSPGFWADDYEDPDCQLFEVLSKAHDVYAGHIVDYERYFLRCGDLDEITYLIPSMEEVDLSLCLERFSKNRLTAYLQNRGQRFVTLGDCHMDDSIVVSYDLDAWRLPDECLAFIR